MDGALECAGLDVSGSVYWSSTLVVSCFLSLFLFIISYSLWWSLWVSVAVLLLVFGLSFSVGYAYPYYRAKKRAEELERELSVALPSLAVQLALGISFERVLKEGGEGGFGVLSQEFHRVHDSVHLHGISVPDALKALSRRTDSLMLKRVCSQLAWMYVNGSGTDELQRFGDSLIVLQRTKLREFHSKLSLIGVLFIVFSGVVPAFYSSWVMLGASFLEWTVSESDILIAYLLVFPLVDLMLLLYVYEKTPKLFSL